MKKGYPTDKKQDVSFKKEQKVFDMQCHKNIVLCPGTQHPTIWETSFDI